VATNHQGAITSWESVGCSSNFTVDATWVNETETAVLCAPYLAAMAAESAASDSFAVCASLAGGGGASHAANHLPRATMQ
jgi:hypothetical protein